MRNLKRVLAAGAVAGLTAGALGTGVAGAAAPYPPNDNPDWVRTAGSDTTYELMIKLEALYNQAPGCVPTVATGGTQNLDGKCGDQDLVTPGKQIGYQVDGAGNSSDPNGATWGGNPDHNVSFQYVPIGSSGGISQLTNRGNPGVLAIESARSSRARRVSDNAGLLFMAYAKDAIPWVAFSDAPGDPSFAVTDLTSTKVTQIFADCGANASNPPIDLLANGGNGNGVADWGDLGGVTGEPLIVWAAQAASGTRATFDGFLGSGKNSTACIPDQYKDGNAANGERVIFENNDQPITATNNTPKNLNCQELPSTEDCRLNSIFYYSLGRWNQAHDPSNQLGSINGVFPNETTVVDGSYQYSRFVYNVYRRTFPSANASEGVKTFGYNQGFLCKPQGKHVINPKTGNNYRTDVENTIRGDGFFPLPFGTTGLGFSNSHCRAS